MDARAPFAECKAGGLFSAPDTRVWLIFCVAPMTVFTRQQRRTSVVLPASAFLLSQAIAEFGLKADHPFEINSLFFTTGKEDAHSGHDLQPITPGLGTSSNVMFSLCSAIRLEQVMNRTDCPLEPGLDPLEPRLDWSDCLLEASPPSA